MAISSTTEEASPITRLSTWLVVLTSVYTTALYGSAVTVAGAVLPQIQGDLSASLDQISWIVTASIVAGAIGTPLTPWLAARFGLKNMMVACIVAVTVASALIGTADSLGEMILWRVCQALMSAPVIALTQRIMLDIFPPEQRGLSMSLWTVGIVSGWVMGPTLGTLLVEWGSWRIAFLAFGPLGLVGIVLCVAFLPRYPKDRSLEFDWFGFVSLSVGLAAIQLVLNRGQRLDWYESTEIWLATLLGIAAVYFFIIHTFTSNKPFLNWNALRDRNLAIGLIILMSYAYISLAPLILIPTMLQDLRGLEVVTVGLLLIPRGLAQIVTTLVMGQFIDRVDLRILIGLGLIGFAVGSWMMASYNLDIGIGNVILPTLVQGMSMAFISVPTMAISYSTIAAELRTDAATLVGLGYTIASSMGVAISVVILTRSAQTTREELASHVVPTNELLRFPQYSQGWDLDVLENLAAIHGEISQQAIMIGYINVYWMLSILCLCVLPLLLVVGKK